MRKLLTMTAASAEALMLCSCSLMKYDDSSDTSDEASTGGYIIPAEFTEDDLEVQTTLKYATIEITEIFSSYRGTLNGYPEYKVIFEQPGDKDGEHAEKIYRMSFVSKTLVFCRTRLRDFLTDEALGMLEENFAAGEEIDKKAWNYWYDEKINQKSDTLRITVTEGDMLGGDGSLKAFPHMIRIDGNTTLCSAEAAQAAEVLNDCFWTTAHITEKTDDKIRFAYIIDVDGTLTERTGILKNENGWKLSWYMDWLE